MVTYMECVICGKQAGFFDKRCEDGYICSTCFSYLPSVVDYRCCGEGKLRYYHDRNQRLRKRFEATASFGSLYIDSVHKMFCISKKHKKEQPTELSDIFSITELEEVALYCKNERNTGQGNNVRIVCDVELYVRTPDFNFRTIISEGEACSYRVVDNTKVKWNEPGIVVMFRSMFNQMINDEGNQILKEINMLRNSKEIAWAEGVLMLGSVYTHDELVQHHDILIRHLHPDYAKDMSPGYAEKISRAFSILENHLTQKERDEQL